MRSKLIPLVLCTMGVLVAFLSGCRKGEEKPAEPQVPSHLPVSYMNDPAFRKQVSDKRKELAAILAERAPLVARMEELVKSNREDLAVLQKIPEWNDLHKKVVALNAKYEAVRQKQLKIVGERLTPKSGRGVSGKSGEDAASPLKSGRGVSGTSDEDVASPLRDAAKKDISK